MEVNFTQKQLVAKVREIATERPNVVYKQGSAREGKAFPPCEYGSGKCSDGSEGRIFGQAFIALGVPSEALDVGYFTGEIDEVLCYLSINDGNGIDDWCLDVQQHQDQGSSWAVAVQLADEAHPITTSLS